MYLDSDPLAPSTSAPNTSSSSAVPDAVVMNHRIRSPVIGVSGSESVAVSLEPARGGSGDKDTLPLVSFGGGGGAAVTADV